MPRPRRVLAGTTPRRWRRQTRMRRQAGVAVFLCIAMVFAGLLLYLWPQMRVVGLQYRSAALQQQRRQALQAQNELRVELATLRQLSRIEDIAMQRLNMHRPHTSQIVYVRSEQNGAAAGERP